MHLVTQISAVRAMDPHLVVSIHPLSLMLPAIPAIIPLIIALLPPAVVFQVFPATAAGMLLVIPVITAQKAVLIAAVLTVRLTLLKRIAMMRETKSTL